ncbi:flavin reductase family protein [Pelagibacterium lacus]|nr:flavin reductase family protein [Pelagibacterium lacus]
MSDQNASPSVDMGDPLADPRAFRRCLGQYATGVTIVTASADGVMVGVTANSFASVSMTPPLVLWSLQNNSTSYDVFTRATHFAINILAADQIELSQRFAKSGPEKFDGVTLSEGAGGAPILDGAAAVLECRREVEHPTGDHLIMVGHVERYRRSETAALVFERGRYAAAVEHPATRFKDDHPQSSTILHRYFIVLLNRAYNRMREAMAAARASEHLDLNESRVLSAVSAYPSRSLDTLQPITFLDRIAAEDAVASLCAKGFLTVGQAAVLTMTPSGSQALDALYEATLAIEGQLLSSIPEDEFAITERTLRAIVGADVFTRQ